MMITNLNIFQIYQETEHLLEVSYYIYISSKYSMFIQNKTCANEVNLCAHVVLWGLHVNRPFAHFRP